MIVRLRRGRRLHAVEVDEADGAPRVRIDGRPFEADIARGADGVYSVLCAGRSLEVVPVSGEGGWVVASGGRTYRLRLEDPVSARAQAAEGGEGPQEIRATLPGKIVEVPAAPGARVKRGDALVVIEAMKMENQLRAPFDARVERVAVVPGQTVETGAPLCVLVPLSGADAGSGE